MTKRYKTKRGYLIEVFHDCRLYDNKGKVDVWCNGGFLHAFNDVNEAKNSISEGSG